MATTKPRYTFTNATSLPPSAPLIIRHLLENWDNVSDTTHAYLSAFSKDATLDLPPYKVTGHEQIRALREASFHPVKGPITDTNHTFDRIFVLPGEDLGQLSCVQVTGVVEYTVAGKVYPQAFSTTFELVGDGSGGYLIKSARIHSESTALNKALAELGRKV
jgi:hypothetical protein